MTLWDLSNRSLLVAVFVLSNFITWTSSKQPLMHHISDLRNRDKRQGAGLSSPSSYVAHDDTCSLPIEEGSCTGSFHRWGYDTKSQSCKQFMWSGCEGNSNQFKTEAACQMRCSHVTEHSKPPKQEQYTTVAQREAIDDKINTKTVTTRKIKKKKTTTSPFSNGCAGFKFGCCYDNKTKALGPDKHGCPCNATEFGCCPDGVTIATSPDQQSCRCQYSTHGCCSDEKTAAIGVNGGGCNCASSKYGCCPDGQTEAIGSNFLGCVEIPENKQDACKLPVADGPCETYAARWYFDTKREQCLPFLYGGCLGNANNFDTRELCQMKCKPDRTTERSTTTKVTRTESLQPGSRDDKKTTLRCLFHRNVPNSETSVIKVNINSTDSDVYVCVVDSELSNVTQNINLVVKETINEVLPNCLRKEAECLHLNCEFGTQYYRSDDGCATCNCSTPEPDCKKEKVECKKLTCKYGIEKIVTANGCERCQCKADNPCDHDEVTCLDNEQCVVIAESAPLSQEVTHYAECRVVSSTIMKPTTLEPIALQSTTLADASTTITTTDSPFSFTGDIDEVSPDCSAYQAECARLNCEYETQYIRTSDGCKRCQCNTPKIDCEPLREECARLRCNYGMERTVGLDGCERCNCKVEVNPCITADCLDTERCVVVSYRDPLTQEPRYDAECRTVLKPGLCPVDDFFSNDDICEDDCYDDTDCHGVGKCCMRGCKKMCVEPAASTLAPTTITTTHTPDLPGPPVALPQPEPEVSWSKGAKATLRCLFHSNPPPRITWRRGELTINGNVGRYRLTSEGALEIVSLYRNDTGVYICVADNGLGTATQQINLVVSDPKATPVGITGDEDAEITGELDRPLVLRCLAYGYPTPAVFWTRYNNMVPFKDRVYETRGNTLLITSLTIETLGQYTCHAYNGVGKAASWVVLVRAYRPDGFFLEHEHLVARQNIYTTRRTPPATPGTTTTTSTTTERRVFFTVPVAVHVSASYSTLNIGTALKLACEVDGYPEPNVYWTKDGQTIVPDDRVLISGITTSRLLISHVTVGDSGLYGCHADNGYSSQSDTAQINVQQLTVPAKCTDNPFYPKCDLIVRNNFCNHKYYSKFCCKSCVEAGLLDPQVAEAQANQPFRKK